MNRRNIPVHRMDIGPVRCLAGRRRKLHLSRMFNILSIVIGLATLALMIPAVLPFVGILNWLFVPMALFGALVGMLSAHRSGRNFCLLVAAFGALRLFMGGGIF